MMSEAVGREMGLRSNVGAHSDARNFALSVGSVKTSMDPSSSTAAYAGKNHSLV